MIQIIELLKVGVQKAANYIRTWYLLLIRWWYPRREGNSDAGGLFKTELTLIATRRATKNKLTKFLFFDNDIPGY